DFHVTGVQTCALPIWGVRRVKLSAGAWVDHQPAWLSGHARLFDLLSSTVRWRESEQQLYDRTVATPRLIAMLPEDGDVHPVLERSEERRVGNEGVSPG